jgi:hypothetical protein
MARPRPVLIFGVVVAVLGVLNESADAANLLPGPVFPWVRLLLSVAVAVGGALFVQARVTPLADPRDEVGNSLVPKTPYAKGGVIR